ncbi:multisubunit Na+/H+ antiporter, MnhC subunit [Desulfocapsa sulfexigens DSM 10523]|uniref:Multisubunit Na+/H+ antiporter, MnhC subunit n=1 Tax=Desulfocapsa sulfexigens (strain DSM 10523 / SB164P1) TaxID=1167006 RepID=M1PIL8_DESSD|nr:cation:proton antiporter subunit C [Desulfocapsa sulfexigens]AGF79435.1 multisubunit Na+/H+ antiporter, MnhC subunit [Desulfocapsa sulfexigens DSM 10523]
MITTMLYSLTGLILFGMGFYTLIIHSHPLRKILAVNVMATGVFLILVATAYIPVGQGDIDPVPHAMVLTGIVVSVSVTALALIFACKVQENSNLDLLRKRNHRKSMKERGL